MLYMMGQRIIENGYPKCLIKVGFSRDIDKRIATYKSDNPSAHYISSTAGVEYEESKCHSFLRCVGKHYKGEWYEVSNEFFINCLKKGFNNNFPLKSPNQNVYMHVKYTTDKVAIKRIERLYNIAERTKTIPVNCHLKVIK